MSLEIQKTFKLDDFAASLYKKKMTASEVEAAVRAKNAASKPLITEEWIIKVLKQAAENAAAEPPRKPIIKKLTDIEEKPVEWVWQNRIPKAAITKFDGGAELGKSFIYMDISTRISLGTPFMDGSPCKQGNVVILSTEDDESRVIKPRLRKMGANTDAIFTCLFYENNGEETMISAKDIDVLESIVEEVKPELIILDPYIALSGGSDSNSADDTRDVLTPLKSFAEKFNLAVFGVGHPNKNSTAKGANRLNGSYQIFATVRANLVVGLNFLKPEDPTSRLFGQIKSNWGPRAKTWEYFIDAQGNFRWGDVVENVKGESVLDGKDDANPKAKAHADARNDFKDRQNRNTGKPMAEADIKAEQQMKDFEQKVKKDKEEDAAAGNPLPFEQMVKVKVAPAEAVSTLSSFQEIKVRNAEVKIASEKLTGKVAAIELIKAMCPVEAEVIIAKAKSLGISRSTVFRARTELGIIAGQDSVGAKAVWTLESGVSSLAS